MREIIKNRKGFEMAFSTIVVIILALLLLATIIFIFSKSASSFREKISGYFSSSNVDSIIEKCSTLAISGGSFEYCCVNNTVKFSSKDKQELTCLQASNFSWGMKIGELNCENIC
jgi:hypothetical protein